MTVIRTVLFDLDGTLVDTLSLIRGTYRTVFAAMGLPWRDGEVMRYIGVSLREIAKRYAGEKADEFIELYQDEYEHRRGIETQAFPGSQSLLEGLKGRGYKTGIVTSKGRRGALFTIGHLGWGPLLDLLVTADDVKHAKPHPEPIIKALNDLNTSADGAVFVGDSLFDFEAGRRAGVRTLAVTWGITPEDALPGLGVDGVLRHWGELEKYLR